MSQLALFLLASLLNQRLLLKEQLLALELQLSFAYILRPQQISSHLGCLCIGAGRECLRLPSLSLSFPRPQVRCSPSGICTNPPFACLIGFGEGVGAWIRVGLDSILSTDELSLKAVLSRPKNE